MTVLSEGAKRLAVQLVEAMDAVKSAKVGEPRRIFVCGVALTDGKKFETVVIAYDSDDAIAIMKRQHEQLRAIDPVKWRSDIQNVTTAEVVGDHERLN